MPVKPQPFKLQCTECNWSKVYAPESDFIPEPFVTKCPLCGSEEIEHVKASAIEVMTSQAESFIDRLKS